MSVVDGAIRVAVAGGAVDDGPAPVIIEPDRDVSAPDRRILVDDLPRSLRLDRLDAIHVVLLDGQGDEASGDRVTILPLEPVAGVTDGVVRREVVVDGWRIEVEIESAARWSLRARARRGREVTGRTPPAEIRAVIPGRVLSVAIAPGDAVVLGQPLLVIEAMKMQNELRAPRDGVAARVDADPGQTIEVGDVLVVLE